MRDFERVDVENLDVAVQTAAQQAPTGCTPAPDLRAVVLQTRDRFLVIDAAADTTPSPPSQHAPKPNFVLRCSHHHFHFSYAFDFYSGIDEVYCSHKSFICWPIWMLASL